MTQENNKITIIYDGECPFCHDFVSLNRFKKLGYQVEIINARNRENPLVKTLEKRHDLDNGMIVTDGEKILYGAEAASFIVGSYSKKNIKGALYWSVLANKKIANASYPILAKLRKLFFKMTGKKLINEDK